MKCEMCGNIIPDNSTRCNVCGYLIAAPGMAQSQFPPNGQQGMPFPPNGQQGMPFPPNDQQGMPFPPNGQQGMPFPPNGQAGGQNWSPFSSNDPAGGQNNWSPFSSNDPAGGQNNWSQFDSNDPAGGQNNWSPFGSDDQQRNTIPINNPSDSAFGNDGQQYIPPYQMGDQQIPDYMAGQVNNPPYGDPFQQMGGMPQNQPPQPEKSKGLSKGVVIGLCIAIALLLCGIGVCLYLLLAPGRSGGDKTGAAESTVEVAKDSNDTKKSDADVSGKTTEQKKEKKTTEASKDEELHIASISDDKFPMVEITVGGKGSVDAEKTVVKEDGKEVEIKDIRDDGDDKVITYIANNISASGNKRSVHVYVDGADLKADDDAAAYNEPQLDSANITLVSCDSSNYPEITLYASVEDANGVITGLTKDNFYIKEKTSKGNYVYKEVSESEMLDQNAALNISLIADKSSSISYSDMDKIKSVLSDFVGNLQYSAGDKAELLAIDDIVRQMCTFTNDSQFLTNGVYSMFPEGMTDLYDGLAQGIQHVVYQEGAKCVIAFTDGENTVDSGYTSIDVVNLAQKYEVPVYVIGVGVDTGYASDLQNIAQSTGGRYWNIDDLYDLNEIYQSIYTQQKQMYKIVYNCNKSVKQDSNRELVISMVDGTYCANNDTIAKPVNVDRTAVERKHDNRYELVMADVTWEEANVAANRAGGHLATITSQAEEDTIINMAEAQGAKYIWLGGYTSYDESGHPFGHWVTGEDFSFQAWGKDEPSRQDLDGTPEWYIMLWNIPELGGWTWNDQRNDPGAAVEYFKGNTAYVIEYEN